MGAELHARRAAFMLPAELLAARGDFLASGDDGRRQARRGRWRSNFADRRRRKVRHAGDGWREDVSICFSSQCSSLLGQTGNLRRSPVAEADRCRYITDTNKGKRRCGATSWHHLTHLEQQTAIHYEEVFA